MGSGASRLKSVNSHGDRGVVVAKRRTDVTFGCAVEFRVSKVSTVTGSRGVESDIKVQGDASVNSIYT